MVNNFYLGQILRGEGGNLHKVVKINFIDDETANVDLLMLKDSVPSIRLGWGKHWDIDKINERCGIDRYGNHWTDVSYITMLREVYD